MMVIHKVNLQRRYDSLYTFQILILLQSKSPMGRKKISKALMIGEGYTRRLLDFLCRKNYIKIQKLGAGLTSKGSTLLKDVRVQRVIIDLQGLAVDLYNIAVLVKSRGEMIRDGLAQRDEAIKVGASGATTLIHHQNKLILPTILASQPINDKITDYFQDVFNLEDNDVIIIGSGPKFFTAERGALAVALSLLPHIQEKIRMT